MEVCARYAWHAVRDALKLSCMSILSCCCGHAAFHQLRTTNKSLLSSGTLQWSTPHNRNDIDWADMQVGLGWASWASVPFIGGSVSPARRALAVFPLLLLYTAMGWLALIKG